MASNDSGIINSPYENPGCPTPGMDGNLGGTSGGADLEDGQKESPNSVSGLPAQQTTISVPDAPAVGTTIGWPELAPMGDVTK